MQVTHGVILTRRGYEERGARLSSLQEAVKLLPSELFRTCLARVRTPATHTLNPFWLSAIL